MTNFRGQVLKEAVTLLTGPDTPPIRYEIRRTYTALGQPESVTLASVPSDPGNLEPGTLNLELSHEVAYSWNTHGQLSGVKSLAGEFIYEYDAKNPALLTKMTGPVHSVATTYEPHRNLITGVTNRRKGVGAEGTPISSYAYSNDILGRRETISQGGEAFALLKLGDTKIDVAYNDRSEVVGAVYKSANETRHEFAYVYDGIGNRKEARSTVGGQRSVVSSYKTNALNQYQEISENQRKFDDDKEGGLRRPSPASSPIAVRPTHDLDGNLVEDAKNRYTWDSENRLVRVESKIGDLRVEYRHDHQSRRTVRIETKNPGKESENRKTTYFLYDGWNLLAELEASTEGQPGTLNFEPATLHTWGRDLSGSLQGAGGVGGLLAVSEGEEHRFPAYDANGNVSQLLDGTGEIAAVYSYDPFGNVTEMAGAEAAGNSWRFSTKPLDAETGWLYYGFRYYNPETGRWLNRDPIEEEGGWNLYGFVGNQAISQVDLLGKIESLAATIWKIYQERASIRATFNKPIPTYHLYDRFYEMDSLTVDLRLASLYMYAYQHGNPSQDGWKTLNPQNVSVRSLNWPQSPYLAIDPATEIPIWDVQGMVYDLGFWLHQAHDIIMTSHYQVCFQNGEIIKHKVNSGEWIWEDEIDANPSAIERRTNPLKWALETVWEPIERYGGFNFFVKIRWHEKALLHQSN